MKKILGLLLFSLMGLGETRADNRVIDWMSQKALSIPGGDYAYGMAKNLLHLPKTLYARGIPQVLRWDRGTPPQESDEKGSTEEAASFSPEETQQDACTDIPPEEGAKIENAQPQDIPVEEGAKIENAQPQDIPVEEGAKIENAQSQELLARELLNTVSLHVHKTKKKKNGWGSKSPSVEASKVILAPIVKRSSSAPQTLSGNVKNKSEGNKKHALVNNVIVLPRNPDALEELKKAQRKSVRQETLSDGKVVFYMKDRPARNPDQTISVGHTYITKYDPKTGEVISWDEGHDSSGKVTRFRPKMVNSMHVTVPHYPPVHTDRQSPEFATDVKKFETVEGVRELLAQWQDIPQLREFLHNKLASLEKKGVQQNTLKNRPLA